MKKCNGTGLVLKICEMKNNVWKKYRLSIQNSIDNHIKITYIKPNFARQNRIPVNSAFGFTNMNCHVGTGNVIIMEMNDLRYT